MGVAVGTLAAPVMAQAAAELPFGEARIRHFRAVRLSGEAPLYVTPEIHALLESTGPRGDLARHFMRFLKGLGGWDDIRVEDVVTPDVRCIDLELSGLAKPGDGVQALVAFRASMNGAIDYAMTLIEEMLIDLDLNVTEVRIHAEGRHAGTLAGIPATGRQIVYDVQTLNQFKGDRMALRWDRSPNLLAAIRDLAPPNQSA
jgi:hypothetical protein